MCGGTVIERCGGVLHYGLSPRVRGNHPRPRHRRTPARSIPACAGEPRKGRGWRRRAWVYPRVCGGTEIMPALIEADLGLSPRVRGNPELNARLEADRRSIPACAGEPAVCPFRGDRRWVYPRVCGGTKSNVSGRSFPVGLSPRVRGNRERTRQDSGRCRSIPACAGEPSRPSGQPCRSPVYPRVCGGTILTP